MQSEASWCRHASWSPSTVHWNVEECPFAYSDGRKAYLELATADQVRAAIGRIAALEHNFESLRCTLDKLAADLTRKADKSVEFKLEKLAADLAGKVDEALVRKLIAELDKQIEHQLATHAGAVGTLRDELHAEVGARQALDTLIKEVRGDTETLRKLLFSELSKLRSEHDRSARNQESEHKSQIEILRKLWQDEVSARAHMRNELKSEIADGFRKGEDVNKAQFETLRKQLQDEISAKQVPVLQDMDRLVSEGMQAHLETLKKQLTKVAEAKQLEIEALQEQVANAAKIKQPEINGFKEQLTLAAKAKELEVDDLLCKLRCGTEELTNATKAATAKQLELDEALSAIRSVKENVAQVSETSRQAELTNRLAFMEENQQQQTQELHKLSSQQAEQKEQHNSLKQSQDVLHEMLQRIDAQLKDSHLSKQRRRKLEKSREALLSASETKRRIGEAQFRSLEQYLECTDSDTDWDPDSLFDTGNSSKDEAETKQRKFDKDSSAMTSNEEDMAEVSESSGQLGLKNQLALTQAKQQQHTKELHKLNLQQVEQNEQQQSLKESQDALRQMLESVEAQLKCSHLSERRRKVLERSKDLLTSPSKAKQRIGEAQFRSLEQFLESQDSDADQDPDFLRFMYKNSDSSEDEAEREQKAQLEKPALKGNARKIDKASSASTTSVEDTEPTESPGHAVLKKQLTHTQAKQQQQTQELLKLNSQQQSLKESQDALQQMLESVEAQLKCSHLSERRRKVLERSRDLLMSPSKAKKRMREAQQFLSLEQFLESNDSDLDQDPGFLQFMCNSDSSSDAEPESRRATQSSSFSPGTASRSQHGTVSGSRPTTASRSRPGTASGARSGTAGGARPGTASRVRQGQRPFQA